MAKILWGKPDITLTVVSGSSSANPKTASANLTVPTPVADSTQLTTQAGDRHTADIEGGGYEAIRYDKNSFQLEFSVRFAEGRTMPFEDVSHDGVVLGTYKVEVAGGDTSVKMTMNEASVRYEDEYSADDGARRHFYCESIVPATGDQIAWTTAAPSNQ